MSPAANQILQTLPQHQEAIRAFGACRLGLLAPRPEVRLQQKVIRLPRRVRAERQDFDNYMGLKELLEDLFLGL